MPFDCVVLITELKLTTFVSPVFRLKAWGRRRHVEDPRDLNELGQTTKNMSTRRLRTGGPKFFVRGNGVETDTFWGGVVSGRFPSKYVACLLLVGRSQEVP